MTMQRITLAVQWKALDEIPDDWNVPQEWKDAKAAADDGNTLVGYLSTFGNVDLGGDVVEPGAFTKTLTYLKNNGIPLLADHMAMTSYVLGTITDGKEDTKGLLILARLSKAPSAQDTATKLREGHLSKMSMGYETLNEHFSEDDAGHRIRHLDEVKLWEGSVVVFPMNPQATVEGVKHLLEAAAEAGQTAEDIAAAADGVIDHKAGSPNPVVLPTLDFWRAVMVVEAKSGVASDSAGLEPGAGQSRAGADGGADTASGDEPGGSSDESEGKSGGYDRYRSDALIAGRPTGDADPATRANLSERLRWAEADPDVAPLLEGAADH